jgi:hypothetical protein
MRHGIDDHHFISDSEIMEQLSNDSNDLPAQPKCQDVNYQGPRRDEKAAYINSLHFIYEE